MTDAIQTRWLGPGVPYREALARQEDLVAQRLAGAIPDTLLLLEHEPVYTIGRTRDRSSLRESASLPHPVVEINRGGQATYHGPGQLVGYPIVDLRTRGKDLHAYLRFLEALLVDTLALDGLHAGRREGLTGVWVGSRKIASLGVGVRKWITMHGFALNVTRESLPPFLSITPCGIADVTMTCMESETGTPHGVQAVGEAVARQFVRAMERGLTR